MDNYLILTGGSLDEKLVREYVEKKKDLKIICVDGALVLSHKIHLTIDYLVGDYDTVPNDLLEQYKKAVKEKQIKTKILSYNPEKDDTDTQIAMSLAVKKGAREICILGGTGSRIDHLLTNIHLLLEPLSKEINAYILDGNNKIYLKNQSFQVEKKRMYGEYFSLIPLTQEVKAVTLTGFKYNTDHVNFPMGIGLGVSNKVENETAYVEFLEGIFVVIESKD